MGVRQPCLSFPELNPGATGPDVGDCIRCVHQAIPKPARRTLRAVQVPIPWNREMNGDGQSHLRIAELDVADVSGSKGLLQSHRERVRQVVGSSFDSKLQDFGPFGEVCPGNRSAQPCHGGADEIVIGAEQVSHPFPRCLTTDIRKAVQVGCGKRMQYVRLTFVTVQRYRIGPYPASQLVETTVVRHRMGPRGAVQSLLQAAVLFEGHQPAFKSSRQASIAAQLVGHLRPAVRPMCFRVVDELRRLTDEPVCYFILARCQPPIHAPDPVVLRWGRAEEASFHIAHASKEVTTTPASGCAVLDDRLLNLRVVAEPGPEELSIANHTSVAELQLPSEPSREVKPVRELFPRNALR